MYRENREEFLEESIEMLYESAPCGYLSTLPDGTIIKINQTLLNWLGYSKKEVVDTKKFQNLLPIGGKIFYETYHAPLLQMQGSVKELNYDILRKDRTKFPALINAQEVKDRAGNVILTLTIIFDITDRKKYELELLEAKRKAEEATSSKSELFSGIAMRSEQL